MLSYLFQVYALLTTLISQRVYGQACAAGWFGDDCKLVCRCRQTTTCDKKSGECTHINKCKNGYFGPGCQYVDLVDWFSLKSVSTFLRDSDDSTCNPDPKATSVELIQSEYYGFSWFRIVIDNPKYLLNFTTTLNNGQRCSNERKFPFTNNVVDVTCDNIVNLEKLKIDGPIAGSICSVYISGGRNVALRQKASQSSISHAGQPERAVDGNPNPDYVFPHCSHTNLVAQEAWWSVTFSQPYILNFIRIVNRDGLQDRIRGFEVKTLTQNGTQVAYFKEHASTNQDTYTFTVQSLTPVTTVTVTQKSGFAQSNSILTLCEVEVFGETICPANTYGILCQHSCNCDKAQACLVATGACTAGCASGFYGFTCKTKCSQGCRPRTCEWATGQCFHCADGFVGAICDTECNETFYGKECKQRCSRNCQDKKCHPSTGECMSCVPGYNGKWCQYGNSPSWWLILIVTICIVSLCFLFLMKSKKEEEGEKAVLQ